jgi:hypothetical protein|tara:strand:- start:3300 stop:3971 length:672 start_codon:yes stop_codon:yes gene_type:complete
MILNDVITEVRRMLQDENAPQRYSDIVLLGFANQSLKRIAVLRPDLFAKVGTMTCVQNEVIQSAPTDSLRVMEIFSVSGGNGCIETNREALDQAYPQWMNDTASATVNWMRHTRNANKFFIYPKAPANQVLDIEYAQTPPTYDGTTAVELLSDAYFPVVVDATIFLAESIDNEHVNTGRADVFYKSFTQSLAVNAQSKIVTDTEAGGMLKVNNTATSVTEDLS